MVIVWFLAVWNRGAASILIMTVITETQEPMLTYSKSRGLVALVTGMDNNKILIYDDDD